MLKIKDNVDLKELEKYGCELSENTLGVIFGTYGRKMKRSKDCVLTLGFENGEDLIFIPTVRQNKNIELVVTVEGSPGAFFYASGCFVEPYIGDLIKARLVEDVLIDDVLVGEVAE